MKINWFLLGVTGLKINDIKIHERLTKNNTFGPETTRLKLFSRILVCWMSQRRVYGESTPAICRDTGSVLAVKPISLYPSRKGSSTRASARVGTLSLLSRKKLKRLRMKNRLKWTRSENITSVRNVTEASGSPQQKYWNTRNLMLPDKVK